MSPLSPGFRRTVTRPWVAVVVTSLVALAARLVALGHRVFYYDEAWFGYWTLKFLDTGVWEYRPILHGPFFVRVNSVVFSVFGASDFTARLVVALVGGLLPLSALLFRERLRDGEVVALSLLLAFTPTLLYYSRFMRKDLPLAAFMLTTLGLLVRAHDTGRPRYLYASAVTFGLACTTKESVLLWVLTYLGAGALVVDRHLLTARYREGRRQAVRSALVRVGRGLRRWARHLLVAAVLFLTVVVLFYAPRAGSTSSVGLWNALGGQFGMLPDVVAAATLEAWDKAIAYWAEGGKQSHPYLRYFLDTLRTLAAGALAVCLLAVVGFLFDRYTGDRPRSLVGFSTYAGVAAVLGYPLANFLPVPWSTIHAVVPLTIPAAVGACAVYRWGRGDLSPVASGLPPLSSGGWLPDVLRPDGGREVVSNVASRGQVARAARVAIAAIVLVALAAHAGSTAVTTSYLASDVPAQRGGSELVYYAQPPNELRTVVGEIEQAAATGGEDVDVLYVGKSLAMDERAVRRPPATGAWFRRVPLPWYTEAAGADVASVAEPRAVTDPPPVVVTTTRHYERLDYLLPNHYTRRLYSLDGIGDRTVVVYTT